MNLFKNKKGQGGGILALIIIAVIAWAIFKAPAAPSTTPAPTSTAGQQLVGSVDTSKCTAANIDPSVVIISNSTGEAEATNVEVRAYNSKNCYGQPASGSPFGKIPNENNIGISIGATYDLYGGNDTDNRFYVEPKKDYIASANEVVRLDAWSVVRPETLDVIVWDPLTSAEMTAGTNTTKYTYNVTMGANEIKNIQIRLRNTDGNGVFRFGGFAYGIDGSNLIAFEDLTESGKVDWNTQNGRTIPYSGGTYRSVTSKNLSSTVIEERAGVVYPTSPKYRATYLRDTAQIIPKYSRIDFAANIKAGSSNPAASLDTAIDGVWITALDSAYTICAGPDASSQTKVCTHSDDRFGMVDSVFSQDNLENVRPGADETITAVAGGAYAAFIATA